MLAGKWVIWEDELAEIRVFVPRAQSAPDHLTNPRPPGSLVRTSRYVSLGAIVDSTYQQLNAQMPIRPKSLANVKCVAALGTGQPGMGFSLAA